MPRRQQSDEERRNEIAEVVKNVLGQHEQQREEERDPNKKWLRGAIREEVQNAINGIIGEGTEQGGRGRREREDESESDEEGGSFLEAMFGGKS